MKQFSIQMKMVKSTGVGCSISPTFCPGFKKLVHEILYVIRSSPISAFPFNCPLTNAEHCEVTRNPLVLYLCESCSRVNMS